MVKSNETDRVFTNICCLPSQVRGLKHIICNRVNQMEFKAAWFGWMRFHFACYCGGFLLFYRGHQFSGLSYKVVHNTFVYILWNVAICSPDRMWSEKWNCNVSWVHSHLHLKLSTCYWINQDACLCQVWGQGLIIGSYPELKSCLTPVYSSIKVIPLHYY